MLEFERRCYSTLSTDFQQIKQFLSRADECFAAGRDNVLAGRYNRAASDLYYAAFNSARALLWKMGISTNNHPQVITGLKEINAKYGFFSVRDEELLDRLIILRQIGDYSTKGKNIEKKMIEPYVPVVEEFIRKTIMFIPRIHKDKEL